MPEYQGCSSWNAWNVALWIGNDEHLYRGAIRCLEKGRTLTGAAHIFLKVCAPDKTPDGARYNFKCVKEALAGLK